MAHLKEIADLLDPLVEQLTKRMSELHEYHPLALVHERISRLADDLRYEPPIVDKMKALHELAFLKEHSLNEEMAGFHDSVQQAIDRAMTPGWS